MLLTEVILSYFQAIIDKGGKSILRGAPAPTPGKEISPLKWGSSVSAKNSDVFGDKRPFNSQFFIYFHNFTGTTWLSVSKANLDFTFDPIISVEKRMWCVKQKYNYIQRCGMLDISFKI